MQLRRLSSLLFVGALALAGCGPKTAHIDIGRMPEGGTFHGVWASPQYGRMHLCMSNNTVVGEYTQDERLGMIQGRVTGDVLRFEWSEERELVVGRPTTTHGHGYFRLVVGEDGNQYLRGEWGLDDDEIGGGEWNAVKLGRERPTECYAHVRQRGGQQPTSGGADDDIRFSDEAEPTTDSTSTDTTAPAPATGN